MRFNLHCHLAFIGAPLGFDRAIAIGDFSVHEALARILKHPAQSVFAVHIADVLTCFPEMPRFWVRVLFSIEETDDA